MAYGSGFRAGLEVAQQGVEAYDKARAWQDKLKERGEEKARQTKIDAAAASKERFAETEKGIADDRAQGKESFVQQAKKQEIGIQKSRADAALAHEQRMEAIARGRAGSGGKGPGMTDAQKQHAISLHTSNYLKAKKDKDQYGMDLYGKYLTDLGAPLPKEQKEPSFWSMHGPKWLGGGSASAQPVTGGSNLPGLE